VICAELRELVLDGIHVRSIINRIGTRWHNQGMLKALGLIWPVGVALLVAAPQSPYRHANEPIGGVREIYDGTLTPERAASTFRNIDRLFPSRTVHHAGRPTPLLPGGVPLTAVPFVADGRTYSLDDYLELNHVASMMVIKDGQVRLERYRLGNAPDTRWMSMSIAKSVTSTLIGAAIKQGKIHALTDPVTRYVPALAGSAYDGATVRDVLTMSSGARWDETYTNPASDRRHLLDAQIAQKPGGLLAVMRNLPRAAPPGTVNNYSTGETQVAAEILHHAIGMPLADYLADRIWTRVPMAADATWWLDAPNGVEIGGSGISATLRDYARFGLFILNGGVAGGEHILPDGWTTEATTPKVLRGGQPIEYGYLWWTGTSPAAIRDHAFGAEGINGQFIFINPAQHVVITVLSARPKPLDGEVIHDWPFFDAIVAALGALHSTAPDS
jgi:CubicO group peptidase (beta-lactamase class C family)